MTNFIFLNSIALGILSRLFLFELNQLYFYNFHLHPHLPHVDVAKCDKMVTHFRFHVVE